MLLLPDQLRTAIDEHQRGTGIVSRNEAIRRLIEAGLKATPPLPQRKLGIQDDQQD